MRARGLLTESDDRIVHHPRCGYRISEYWMSECIKYYI